MTEFEEKREELARSLFELYHGEGSWEHYPELHDNYRLDARDVLVLQPHLLSVPERVRLWREERELVLATLATIDRAEVRAGWEMFFIEMREAVDE